MNTLEYVGALKKRLNIESDYALAKELGVAKQTVARYSKGVGHFDEPVCRRVAEILGIHAGLVLLDMQRERAKTPEDRAVWTSVLEKFSMGFDFLTSCATPRRIRLSA